jgi:hypothetical protein
MKNKIVFIILFFCCFNLISQTDVSKTDIGRASFGIFAGVNFQNINGTDRNGDRLKNSLVTKFHAGLSEQIPVAPEFFVEVGLQYIGKGTKGTVPYNTTTVTREISLNYIELPVNLLYKPLIGTGHFLLGFGPYFGYAFSGKAKFTGDAYTATPSILFAKEINTSNPNDLVYFKHMDIGANAFFGWEFANNINVVFDAQLGLVNVNSKNPGIPNNKLSEMNTGFGLKLGYRF